MLFGDRRSLASWPSRGGSSDDGKDSDANVNLMSNSDAAHLSRAESSNTDAGCVASGCVKWLTLVLVHR